MPVTPLKPTELVYNRTQHCSRVEILRDPAVVVDYGFNKQDYIKSDIQNLYAEAEGIIAQPTCFINVSGSDVQVNPGYGVYRNFIFNVPSVLSISAAGQPVDTTYYLVLKIVEKRFTSGATTGGTETDNNALEGSPGSNPYGDLWPIVQAGYDPNNCLQIDVSNESAFDTYNEWRFKWEWQLLSAIPANQAPIAGKEINIYYVNAAQVDKDSAGVVTVVDMIYSNRIIYKDRNNLFSAGQTMLVKKGVSIVDKSQVIPPSGLVTNKILQFDGSTDFYMLDLDDAAQMGTYNPFTGSILPGIDIIAALPNAGIGNTFILYVTAINNPTKRLRMSGFSGVQVVPDYIYEPTLPGNNAFGQVDLYPGSLTVFTVVRNRFRIVDGTHHLAKNVYGSSDWSNITYYSKFTTHKDAIDKLADQIVAASTLLIGSVTRIVTQSVLLQTNVAGGNVTITFKKLGNHITFDGIGQIIPSGTSSDRYTFRVTIPNSWSIKTGQPEVGSGTVVERTFNISAPIAITNNNSTYPTQLTFDVIFDGTIPSTNIQGLVFSGSFIID